MVKLVKLSLYIVYDKGTKVYIEDVMIDMKLFNKMKMDKLTFSINVELPDYMNGVETIELREEWLTVQNEIIYDYFTNDEVFFVYSDKSSGDMLYDSIIKLCENKNILLTKSYVKDGSIEVLTEKVRKDSIFNIFKKRKETY